jgi:hypothetical protein
LQACSCFKHIKVIFKISHGSNKRIAVYWKNGVETQLLCDGSSPIKNAIYVKGSDVYVAGYEFFPTGTTAIYWKNGVETKLAGNGSNSSATSIFVN